ncbi:MAG: 4-(cytidine 5'-diphospho)-2-C-methyl-D-erythritol kinase [Oceanospirillaceae bacterium]|nr:4-(cytidine 5'-diphospho)-2-C-methyl-D-erythritol kinase [Oceanospirillaceae bacterium]
MKQLTVPSPAKLNLFLHINGRRADGYHELQTIFQFIEYGDTLYLSERDDGEIHLLTEFAGVPAEQNLIVRAARLLQNKTGCTKGADIRIDKILPMGGGLGGGSSNAASAMVGLNDLWQAGASINDMAAWGLSLGADVPVFIRGEACWAEGVGEIITPMPQLDENWFVVVVPPCQVNTGKIFSHEGLTRDTPKCKISAALRGQGRNDCEAVVKNLYKDVANSLNLLDNFGTAKMTGTGACVYTETSTEEEAKQILSQLPESVKAFVAKGINRNPLQNTLHVIS